MQKHLVSTTLFGIALLLLLTSGCATLQLQQKDAVYHRTADYVVYQLKPEDTAASVARKFLGDASKSWMIEDANKILTPFNWIVVPLNLPNTGGIYSNGVQQVSILCYHQFGTEGSLPLSMPADLFDRQMQYLKDNGYHVIGPEQLLAFLEYRQSIPKKSVMITINIGCHSAYTIAYPILKKYGYTATLFVYTNYVEKAPKAITWEQLRKLKQDGFTIGSHSMSHSDLSRQWDGESKETYVARLRREIINSKRIIDNKLNQDTYFFAYPYGRTNRTVSLITQKAGYKLAVTNNGGGNSFYANPYLLHRDQVLVGNLETFSKNLNTFKSLSLR